MSASVTWQGLLDLQIDLRNLPADLAEEAADIIEDAADRTRQGLYQVYPPGPTGNLRRGVAVIANRSTFGISVQVRSRAPHAHLWEWGSKARHNRGRTLTPGARVRPSRARLGWNRGSMPTHAGIEEIAVRERARMWPALKALVERAGFVVHA